MRHLFYNASRNTIYVSVWVLLMLFISGMVSGVALMTTTTVAFGTLLIFMIPVSWLWAFFSRYWYERTMEGKLVRYLHTIRHTYLPYITTIQPELIEFLAQALAILSIEDFDLFLLNRERKVLEPIGSQTLLSQNIKYFLTEWFQQQARISSQWSTAIPLKNIVASDTEGGEVFLTPLCTPSHDLVAVLVCLTPYEQPRMSRYLTMVAQAFQSSLEMIDHFTRSHQISVWAKPFVHLQPHFVTDSMSHILRDYARHIAILCGAHCEAWAFLEQEKLFKFVTQTSDTTAMLVDRSGSPQEDDWQPYFFSPSVHAEKGSIVMDHFPSLIGVPPAFSFVWLPIILSFQQRKFGVFVVRYAEDHTFSQDEQQMLTLVAHLCALDLLYSQYYQQAARRYRDCAVQVQHQNLHLAQIKPLVENEYMYLDHCLRLLSNMSHKEHRQAVREYLLSHCLSLLQDLDGFKH